MAFDIATTDLASVVVNLLMALAKSFVVRNGEVGSSKTTVNKLIGQDLFAEVRA